MGFSCLGSPEFTRFSNLPCGRKLQLNYSHLLYRLSYRGLETYSMEFVPLTASTTRLLLFRQILSRGWAVGEYLI